MAVSELEGHQSIIDQSTASSSATTVQSLSLAETDQHQFKLENTLCPIASEHQCENAAKTRSGNALRTPYGHGSNAHSENASNTHSGNASNTHSGNASNVRRGSASRTHCDENASRTCSGEKTSKIDREDSPKTDSGKTHDGYASNGHRSCNAKEAFQDEAASSPSQRIVATTDSNAIKTRARAAKQCTIGEIRLTSVRSRSISYG